MLALKYLLGCSYNFMPWIAEKEKWYLERYTTLSSELKGANEINNTSKGGIKRNSFSFRKYEYLKAEILFSRVHKNIGSHLG